MSRRTRATKWGGGRKFWDDFYAKHVEKEEEATFEWLRDYADLQNCLEDLTGGDRSCRILHVGCGNSTITENMYDDGYHEIVNIDVSPVVIEQMLLRNEGRSGMMWIVMDARKLEFDAASFDLVLDKGTLDAFMCGGSGRARKYIQAVLRVLRPGGVFFCVSLGEPCDRLGLFEGLPVSVETIEFAAKSAKETPDYAYICKVPRGPVGPPPPELRTSCALKDSTAEREDSGALSAAGPRELPGLDASGEAA